MNFEYTATEDCFLGGRISSSNYMASININDVEILSVSSSSVSSMNCAVSLYIKKGQILKITNANGGKISIFALV